MRSKLSNIFIGLIFVAVGVAVCGNILDFWEFNLFFDGWWTMFIIIPCLFSMIRHGIHTGSVIGLGIGVVLLLNQLDILKHQNLWKLIFPVIIIAIGISIIFKGFTKKDYSHVVVTSSADGSDGRPDYSAVFGECSPNYSGTEFHGCTASAVFGAVTLDLRTAIINSDCVIDASSVFGGTDIYLPSNVRVKVSSTPIFGGVDDKTISSSAPGAPTVYINATCVFGGTDIK